MKNKNWKWNKIIFVTRKKLFVPKTWYLLSFRFKARVCMPEPFLYFFNNICVGRCFMVSVYHICKESGLITFSKDEELGSQFQIIRKQKAANTRTTSNFVEGKKICWKPLKILYGDPQNLLKDRKFSKRLRKH